jgi:hypothetical protein
VTKNLAKSFLFFLAKVLILNFSFWQKISSEIKNATVYIEMSG